MSDYPDLAVAMHALAHRFDARARMAKDAAKALRAAADHYGHAFTRYTSPKAQEKKLNCRMFMAAMTNALRVYREFAERLSDGASNTVPFHVWLEKIYEIRDDEFGDTAEYLLRVIGARDFPTFTSLAVFLRRQKREELLGPAQRLYSMWFCFKHDIGINPTNDFYRLEKQYLPTRKWGLW